MTVGELVALLNVMPQQAPLVFEDATEEDGSYENVEIEFNANSEVVIRIL